jgi:hypothetical protein
MNKMKDFNFPQKRIEPPEQQTTFDLAPSKVQSNWVRI